jgi:Transposase IS66 family
MLAKVSGGSRIARAIRYALKHWTGLAVFLDDGRVEIDSNVVERSIRPDWTPAEGKPLDTSAPPGRRLRDVLPPPTSIASGERGRID